MVNRRLIVRKPNPYDGRGVLIHITEIGREKREFSKEKVLQFNEAVRKQVPEEKLKHFYEVMTLINDLIANKKIFNH